MKELKTSSISFTDYLKIIDGIFEKYGSMTSFWLGPRMYILLKDPRRIQSVLLSQECLNRDDVYEFINLLGDGGGLMTLKGDTWKAHRKFLNPCFSPRILQSYMPIFNEQSVIMMKNLEEKCGTGHFNFYNSMDACTLDMICRKFRVNICPLTSSYPDFSTIFNANKHLTCIPMSIGYRNHTRHRDEYPERRKPGLFACLQQVSKIEEIEDQIINLTLLPPASLN